jgi:catechol 2,3-dioxygenase-like lactoylglutathione lyase family enzyme
MAITSLDRSAGNTLGFEVSGDVTKADYQVLTPAVAAAVSQHGTVNLLLDLTGFHWEKASAWGADLHFGHEYHNKIGRMAIVGDKNWEKHLASICSPCYAAHMRPFGVYSGYFTDPDGHLFEIAWDSNQ